MEDVLDLYAEPVYQDGYTARAVRTIALCTNGRGKREVGRPSLTRHERRVRPAEPVGQPALPPSGDEQLHTRYSSSGRIIDDRTANGADGAAAPSAMPFWRSASSLLAR